MTSESAEPRYCSSAASLIGKLAGLLGARSKRDGGVIAAEQHPPDTTRRVHEPDEIGVEVLGRYRRHQVQPWELHHQSDHQLLIRMAHVAADHRQVWEIDHQLLEQRGILVLREDKRPGDADVDPDGQVQVDTRCTPGRACGRSDHSQAAGNTPIATTSSRTVRQTICASGVRRRDVVELRDQPNAIGLASACLHADLERGEVDRA
jgi:hypothetical protein